MDALRALPTHRDEAAMYGAPGFVPNPCPKSGTWGTRFPESVMDSETQFAACGLGYTFQVVDG